MLAFQKTEHFLILSHPFWEGETRTEYAIQDVSDPWIYSDVYIVATSEKELLKQKEE